MSNFALSSSDNYDEVIGGLNYVLSNLGNTVSANVTYNGNIMVANTATGVISSVNGSGQTQGNVISYLYNYINIKYANSASGASGFTSNPTSANYYGLRNSNGTAISNNPTDYTWTQVAGGFGTTKGLYYYNIGGNQILFAVDTAAPTATYSLAQPDTPIYLPTIANNAVNTTQLVVNSATQALFAQGQQQVQQLAFVNGNTSQSNAAGYIWPDNTRGFAIGGGITIVPQSNGSGSGSQIQINYNAYINTQGNSEVTNYNLVELWKDQPSKQYLDNFLAIVYAPPSGTTIGGNLLPITEDLFIGGGTYACGFQIATDFSANANAIVTSGTINGLTTSAENVYGYYQTPIAGVSGGWFGGGPIIMKNSPFFSGGYIVNGKMTYSQSQSSSGPQNPQPLPAFNINGIVTCECYWSTLGGGREQNTYPTICVGPGGRIATIQNTSYNNLPYANVVVAYAYNESSGVFSDLQSISADRTLSSTNNYTTGYNSDSWIFNAVAVGSAGTILHTRRQYNAGGNIIVDNGWTQSSSGTTQRLNAVAANWSADLSGSGGVGPPGPGTVANLWVAVGNSGTILYAPNSDVSGPQAWSSANVVPTTQNLYGVSYTQGLWTAVGAGGTLITSPDGSNWSGPISNPAATNNLDLYSCAGGQLTGNTIAGGQGIVIRSLNKAGNSWTTVYQAGAAVTSNLTRLAYYGSNANIANVSMPPPEQRIANAQVISNTYTDTNYFKGVPETYYLVIGNNYGNANIYTGGSTITVTEIKR